MTNSEQVKEEIKALGLQPSAQIIPQPIPVVETNPKLLRRCDVVKASTLNNATGVTIFTTDANKDTYITAIQLHSIKDATSQSVYSKVNCYLANGLQQDLLRIGGITLTAQDQSAFIAFPVPILTKRNTAVNVNCSNATANILISTIVYAYTVEDNQ